ncbi:hypothetical protein CGC48_07190 [Capnocytophaga cynodegmi]|uniref:Uncharacterized protein n=1 Tax=Capnocytophaga cynodegmi TaxID=28189 RepID=A0A250E694_9FLAO|nr:DUF6707 family protein [Capnocytophaga cynodegmi]ATA68433.1 hypothetical protein CGC48_07190 [Capnocytophaga cynodegmi]
MNIPFEKIEAFCITKKQQKNLEKLKKKFSIKNSANRETLSDLMDSLFICEKYEPLLALLPEVLSVPFEEDFLIWGDMESYLAIIVAVPNITANQRKAIFEHYKSVTHYQSTKKAQESLDYYFHRILSLNKINDYKTEIAEALEEEDLSYEYAMRLGLLKEGSQVKLISEFVDFKTLQFPQWLETPNFENREALQNHMEEIISQQLETLKEKRFAKYN